MTKFNLREIDPDFGREVIVLDDEPADLGLAAEYENERELDRLNRLKRTRVYKSYMRDYRDRVRFTHPTV